jgi:hypothetical protein
MEDVDETTSHNYGIAFIQFARECADEGASRGDLGRRRIGDRHCHTRPQLYIQQFHIIMVMFECGFHKFIQRMEIDIVRIPARCLLSGVAEYHEPVDGPGCAIFSPGSSSFGTFRQQGACFGYL